MTGLIAPRPHRRDHAPSPRPLPLPRRVPPEFPHDAIALAQLAQRENLPLDAAVRAYDLRTSTSEESGRIFNDQTLTTDQKRAAMQTLAQNAKAQLIGTLGPNAGAAYASSATWLQASEKGVSIRFHP